MADTPRFLYRTGWFHLRIAAFGILTLLSLVLPLNASAESYTLRPGDQLRLSILDLPLAPVISQVRIDGRVSFPYLGSFDAVDSTLEDLQERISLASTGKVVSVYNEGGQRLQVALEGTGIFLEIAIYRPVYMTGDVASRGPVEYLPGMTIRTALASAGGTSEVPVMFAQAVLQAPDLKSRYQTLAIQHARAVVNLWGIDAVLAGESDQPAIDATQVAIAPNRLVDFTDAERRNVEFRLDEIERRTSYLNQQIDVLTDQINRFQGRIENQEKALNLETEQMAQIEDLVDRGLAAATRLTDAQQDMLAVSSSVLDAESAMADLTLRREELQQELETVRFALEREYRSQRAELVPGIVSLAAQLQAARQSLAMNGVLIETEGPQEPSIAFEIARTDTGGTTIVSDAAIDTVLLPGDVVDVRLSYPFSQTLAQTGAAPASNP